MQAEAILSRISSADFAEFCGEVTRVGQRSMTADGPLSRVGDVCRIGRGADSCLAEVVAVDRDRVELVPLREQRAVRPGDTVTLSHRHSSHPVGDGFAGRAIDAFGRPIDSGPAIYWSNAREPALTAPMAKTIVPERVETGIRAIDTLLPVAQGQRIGIFAASGVGKTTLIEQLSLRVACDKVVVCLVGERGREVERLWNLHANTQGSAPVTVVAATSDETASVRVRAVRQALALCELWRERGEHVVFFVDSITRYAMALRDIGLAAGEPPALRSYTPNVFSALPELVERCGAISGQGSITAIFSVLSETDDVDDPIAETMRSLLDGHVILSRKLAERGHYPAIDIRASVSRIADQVLSRPALDAALQLKAAIATYEDARSMIESGLYQSGADPDIDRAIALWPGVRRFLMQDADASDLDSSDRALRACLAGGG